MNEIREHNIDLITCVVCKQKKERYFKPLTQGWLNGKDICIECFLKRFKSSSPLDEIPGRYGNSMKYLYTAFDDEDFTAARMYLEDFESEINSKFSKKLKKWHENLQKFLEIVNINLSHNEVQEKIELRNYWDGKKSLLEHILGNVEDFIAELDKVENLDL